MTSRPADCPRLRDGGLGPRACSHDHDCRFHNLHASRQRRPPAPARVRVALELADDCALDAAARTRRGGKLMPYWAIGLRLGVSKQRASIIADLALCKLATKLGLQASPGVLAVLLRRGARR